MDSGLTGFFCFRDVDWARIADSERGSDAGRVAYLYHDSPAPPGDLLGRPLDIKATRARKPLFQGNYERFLAGAPVKGVWDRRKGEFAASILGGGYHQMMYETGSLLERLDAFLRENPLRQVLDPTLPHAWEQVLLMYCCIEAGVPYRFYSPSLLPWCVRIKQPVHEGFLKYRDEDGGINRSDGDKALTLFKEYSLNGWSPDFGKTHRGTRTWFHGGVRKTALSLCKKMVQWKLFREHQNVAVATAEPGSVVVYLHYQPEMTTMPAGGMLTNQMLLVERLREMGKKVYLKEHPGQFQFDLSMRCSGRWLGFYNWAREEYDVEFLRLEYTLDDILKMGCEVATVNGTVAVEAAARNVTAYLPEETLLLADSVKRFLEVRSGMYELSSGSFRDILKLEAENSICLMDRCRSANYPALYDGMLKMAITGT